MQEFAELKLEQLVPHKDNLKYFDDIKGLEYEELKDSIRNSGINEPLIVMVSKDDDYIILSGHQRYRVALDLKLETVPCIIRNFEDEEAVATFIVECNVRRRQLTVEQKAKALGELYVKLKSGRKDERIKKIAALSDTPIKATRKLVSIHTDLIEEIKNIILTAGLSEEELYEISKLPAKLQYTLYEKVKLKASEDVKEHIKEQVQNIKKLKERNSSLVKDNQNMHKTLSRMSLRGDDATAAKDVIRQEIVKDIVKINTGIFDLLRKCKESGVALSSLKVTNEYDDIDISYTSSTSCPPLPLFKLIPKKQIEQFIHNSQDTKKLEKMMDELVLRYLEP
jgi:ParB/RepB/Spo0J family partition protein